MKKTEFPLKKTFEQEFIAENWRSLFVLTYDQATISEYDEFMFLGSEHQIRSIINMVRKQIPLNFFQRVIHYFLPLYTFSIERSIDMNLIVKNVMINKFRSYESIFDDVPSYMFKKNDNQKGLYSSNISAVCNAYHISISDLRDKMTLEQYFWMVDGINFQWNQHSKEGKAINNMALVDRKAISERTEKTKQAFLTRKTK